MENIDVANMERNAELFMEKMGFAHDSEAQSLQMISQ